METKKQSFHFYASSHYDWRINNDIRQLIKEMDKLKTAAGVKVDTKAPKNDFTESLRIAAGIL